jgi:C-terminal processing protease CtpA/Prc
MKSIGGLVLASVVLSGCAANPFEKNYSPRPNSETVFSNPVYEHPTGEAKVYACSGDAKSCSLRAQEEGYEYLGMSSFYGPAQSSSREQIIEQAKKVGASMVLVRTKYKDTLSGVVPGASSVYDSEQYGSLAISKYSTTLNQGQGMTNNVPYTMIRYDTVATFWVHLDMNQVHLGVVAESLPEDVRARLQRNAGVIAVAVMRGTPAFDANILRNDVILKIGGEDVIDTPGLDKLITRFAGQRVDIELLRGDTPKTISVALHRPN